MWEKIKKFFKTKEQKIKPAVNKALDFYVKYEDILEKGVKPAVQQAVKMGYVKEGQEDKLVEQIEKGMKKASEEMEKRENENGVIWK